jgi:hypothetical protein
MNLYLVKFVPQENRVGYFDSMIVVAANDTDARSIHPFTKIEDDIILIDKLNDEKWKIHLKPRSIQTHHWLQEDQFILQEYWVHPKDTSQLLVTHLGTANPNLSRGVIMTVYESS